MTIDWNYPPPRQGILGAIDQLTGPGATRAELALQFIPPLLAAIAAPVYALFNHLEWDLLQLAVSAVLAFDLTGGIITNATSTAKRWYHRAGQEFPQHFGFVAIHGLHLFIVAWLFRSLDWEFFIATSSYLLVAAAIALKVSLYLQRPVALSLYALALLISSYGFTQTVGLEWFLPFFFLKLLVSHLLHEEPYRPLDDNCHLSND